MATPTEHIVELEKELALAVAKGDLDAAKAAIDMLACYSSRWALAQIEARATVAGRRPMLGAEPMALPMPGHLPGSTLANPLLAG